jgi:hypothetical protein
VKIFFAGAEEYNKAFPAMNRLRVRYRLMSYYYLRKKKQHRLEELIYRTTPENVVYLIDSGAFTFMETHLGLAKKEPSKWWDQMERYVEDYVVFLDKYKSRIFAAAEMDVDHVLNFQSVTDNSGTWGDAITRWEESYVRNRLNGSMGYTAPPIAYWRERIESAGVPVLVSWHNCREWKGWLDQCQRYKFLGLPSGEGVSESHWFPYVNEARKQGALIHGFAGTKPEWLRRYPFYSADSTTWLMGSKYGTTDIFQNGRLRFYQQENKKVRLRYRWLYEKFGLDWKKIEKEEPSEIDCMNLLAWVQYSTFLTTVPNKDYWTQELSGAPKDSLGPPSDLDKEELLHKVVTTHFSSSNEEEKREVEEDDAAEAVYSEEDTEDDMSKKIMDEIQGEKERSHREKIRGGEVVQMQPRQSQALVQITKNPLRTEEFVPKDAIATADMTCNECYGQDRCKFFQPDASCYFHLTNTFRNVGDLMDGLRMLATAQMQRVSHALFLEKLDGGVLDRNLSMEIARLESSIHGIKEFFAPPEEKLEIKAKGGAVSAILEALGPRRKKPIVENSPV